MRFHPLFPFYMFFHLRICLTAYCTRVVFPFFVQMLGVFYFERLSAWCLPTYISFTILYIFYGDCLAPFKYLHKFFFFYSSFSSPLNSQNSSYATPSLYNSTTCTLHGTQLLDTLKLFTTFPVFLKMYQQNDLPLTSCEPSHISCRRSQPSGISHSGKPCDNRWTFSSND